MTERSQIVVSLGVGDEGLSLRKQLDEAARRRGMPVTTWAREMLKAAAENTPEPGSRHADIHALEKRVKTLEDWRQKTIS